MMTLVDQLLNVAGLLLWFGWRAGGERGPDVRLGLTGVLKPAAPRRSGSWVWCGALVALLAVRSVVYWRVGSEVRWVPTLDLGVISLPFNSVSWARMAVYSAASFGVVLAVVHLWFLLLSVINGSVPDADPWQRRIRRHLGWCGHLPLGLRLVGPWGVAAGLWYAANPALVAWGMAAQPASAGHLAQQAALIGAGIVLAWKYVVVGVLFLSVVNTYLYLGNYSFWTFIAATAKRLLRPLAFLPLRAGQVDFAPVLGLAVAMAAFGAVEWGLHQLFGRLPL